MKLAEGDAFNTAKLRRSRQRIRNLGFFEKVEVTNTPGEQPDRTVVNVELQERSTGEITFGVGFSTADGPIADVRIRERNLLGRGQDLMFGVVIAGKRSEADISFTEPYFLDREIAAGFDIFYITRDFSKEASYDLRSAGFTLRAGYQLTERLRQTLRYTLRQDDINNVEDDASQFIKQQEGSSVTSLVGYDLLYDRRDDRFDPTDGYFIRFSQDFAGLGGDNHWIRNRLASGYYYPFADEWTGSVSGEVGYIYGYNDPVRINQQFYVGGENLRGFRTAGIGPRDLDSNDALGGTKYYTGSVGLTMPSGLPKELGIRWIVFSDFGSLWDTDSTGSNIADVNSIRVSLGAGMAWRSPFGPVRISLAQAVLKESFDRTEVLRFSFGSRF
jgi:outer membrane protein insertion porin family